MRSEPRSTSPASVAPPQPHRIRTPVVTHVRRIAILLLNFFLNRPQFFQIIGWINCRWRFLDTVFVAYPASVTYALSYVYPRYLHLMRWKPWLAGVLWQNGRCGLMFVIASTEADFRCPGNREQLHQLVEAMEAIRGGLGASQKTFAGILPGILFANRLVQETPEISVTIEAVIQAEAQVRAAEGYDDQTPVIILGAQGFLGRRLAARLSERELYGVDIAAQGESLWPDHLRGRKAIVINVTRNTVLCDYVGRFWSDLVLLNEVYPEPSQAEITELTAIGSRAYHVVGVSGQAYPSFPKAYAGGIPCCAGRLDEGLRAIIRRLN